MDTTKSDTEKAMYEMLAQWSAWAFVNGVDAWIELEFESWERALTSQ